MEIPLIFVLQTKTDKTGTNVENIIDGKGGGEGEGYKEAVIRFFSGMVLVRNKPLK